jgi:hypothetical protein
VIDRNEARQVAIVHSLTERLGGLNQENPNVFRVTRNFELDSNFRNTVAEMTAKAAKKRTPWRCPKCGREFAQRSAYHGCGNYTIEGYLAGKNPAGVALFNLLSTAAQKFPGVTLSPAKTQITFRVRANFLMVAVSGVGIHGYIFLPQPVPKPCFKKIVAASSRRHAHQFRITDPATLQNDFIKLLPEAIALVSEMEQRPQRSAKRKQTVGDEINALYRAERRA